MNDARPTSVRSLAADLAVAPNTAHRALRRLIDLGLVEACQLRTSEGRFAAGSIRLAIPSRVLRLGTECQNVPVPEAPTPKSVRRPSPSAKPSSSSSSRRTEVPCSKSQFPQPHAASQMQTGARERARVVPGSMLSVETLHASSAAVTAAYYAKYLTAAPGEVPGVWSGRQAAGLGLSGTVDVEALELLLSGRDPVSGTRLGGELVDRYRANGKAIKAVSGFDATFSAPKSVSVWWALTGDDRLLEAHDVAVAAALEHLERFGSTTRIRSNGGRLHPDTQGLTMATFRQTTSREDDPQIHTHAVISAKVQTADGRWLALDARYLKRYQRMLGGLYQSVLRAELTHRFGVEWRPIVTGQAEIAGFPTELLKLFSKRTVEIDAALAAKLAEFRRREGPGAVTIRAPGDDP